MDDRKEPIVVLPPSQEDTYLVIRVPKDKFPPGCRIKGVEILPGTVGAAGGICDCFGDCGCFGHIACTILGIG